MRRAAARRVRAGQASRTRRERAGANRLVAGCSAVTWRAASSRVRRAMRLLHGAGSTPRMAGRKIRPTRVAMPPAVCRTIAPRPTPMVATTSSSRPPASTAPGTPGWDSDTDRCFPDRTAWTRANEAKATTSPATRVSAPMTAALAASTVRRRGAAANVVRIRPVLYSVLNASTPSTPTARTAYSWLIRPGSRGSTVGCLPGALARVTATRALMAIGQAGQAVRGLGLGDRSVVHALELQVGLHRAVAEDHRVAAQVRGHVADSLDQGGRRQHGQEALVEVLAELVVGGRGPARLVGLLEAVDDPAELVQGVAVLSVAVFGVAHALLECGPGGQPVLAGDGDLGVVQGGELTRGEAAFGLELEVAKARPTGQRTRLGRWFRRRFRRWFWRARHGSPSLTPGVRVLRAGK